MKQTEMTPHHERLLRCFTHLPQQILRLHEIDNATEYVLHSLCDEGFLNLQKAAYFIDNPDFDCLKGIAGFSKEEGSNSCDIVLDDAGCFREHVTQCGYNKKVRTINVPSAKRNGDSLEKIMERLAEKLGMSNPACHSWNIKHDNFGLLIFERDESDERKLREEFIHGLSILGFCPVS